MYTVADILKKDVGVGARAFDSDQTVSADLSLWEAAKKLAASGSRELPVVQDGKVVGVIRKADLVHALQKLGAPD